MKYREWSCIPVGPRFVCSSMNLPLQSHDVFKKEQSKVPGSDELDKETI